MKNLLKRNNRNRLYAIIMVCIIILSGLWLNSL